MADVTGYNADTPVGITGLTTAGVPTTPVASDTSGNLLVKDSNAITVLNTIETNTAAAITDTITTGTIVANGGTVVVNAEGAYTVSVSISGTFVATMVAEGQLADNSWIGIPFYIVGPTTPYAQTFIATGAGVGLLTGGGYINMRLRATSFTSGTVNIAFDASLAQQTAFSAQLGIWQVNTKTPITPASPAVVSVGVATTVVVAANTNRKGLVLTNTSVNKISLAFGVSAVSNSGIVLYPGGTYEMDEYMFTTSAVNAIATVAASALSVQEYS